MNVNKHERDGEAREKAVNGDALCVANAVFGLCAAVEDAATDVKGALCQALSAGLVSPNEEDRNGEAANLVDGLFSLARAVKAGLADLAQAVREHAEAIRDRSPTAG
jgi:hypothetical protein